MITMETIEAHESDVSLASSYVDDDDLSSLSSDDGLGVHPQGGAS